jgi:hypothetical protein
VALPFSSGQRSSGRAIARCVGVRHAPISVAGDVRDQAMDRLHASEEQEGENRWLAQPQQRRRSSRTAEQGRWRTRRSRRSATRDVDRRRRERPRAGRRPRRALPPRSALPLRRAHGSPRRRRNDRRRARPRRRRSGAASRRPASSLGTARRRTSDDANESERHREGGLECAKARGDFGGSRWPELLPASRSASVEARADMLRPDGRAITSSVRGRAARSLEPSPVRSRAVPGPRASLWPSRHVARWTTSATRRRKAALRGGRSPTNTYRFRVRPGPRCESGFTADPCLR